MFNLMIDLSSKWRNGKHKLSIKESCRIHNKQKSSLNIRIWTAERLLMNCNDRGGSQPRSVYLPLTQHRSTAAAMLFDLVRLVGGGINPLYSSRKLCRTLPTVLCVDIYAWMSMDSYRLLHEYNNTGEGVWVDDNDITHLLSHSSGRGEETAGMISLCLVVWRA